MVLVVRAVGGVFSGRVRLFDGEAGRIAVGIGPKRAAELFFEELIGALRNVRFLRLAIAGRSGTNENIARWLSLAAFPVASLDHSVVHLFFPAGGALLFGLPTRGLRLSRFRARHPPQPRRGSPRQDRQRARLVTLTYDINDGPRLRERVPG